jgi:hypothetical protein
MRTRAPKSDKMKTFMDEYKSGRLHSGSKTGPKVTKRKQAIAIGLNQSGGSRGSAPRHPPKPGDDHMLRRTRMPR